jgi:hypothetical protein
VDFDHAADELFGLPPEAFVAELDAENRRALDRIAAALEQAGLGPLRRIHAVKFLAPLLPGQVAQLTATRDGTRLRFRIERDGSPILSGEAETGSGNE